MIRYILRRILIIPPALILINFLGYAYAFLARPERAKRTPYAASIPDVGIADLIPAYRNYLATFFDAATRTSQQTAILETIQNASKASLGLLAIALVVSVALGFLLGFSAVRNEPPGVSRWLIFVSTSGLAMPSFYIGSLMIVGLVTYVVWKGPGTEMPLAMQGFGWDSKHLVLPVIALTARPTMQIAQLTAGLLSGELSKQYVKAGRSLGQTWRMVRTKFALRNIIAPVILTVTGSFRLLVGELVVVEWLFAWTGLGRLLAQTLVPPLQTNFNETLLFLHPEVVAIILAIFGLLFLLADLLASTMVRVFDPRLRE